MRTYVNGSRFNSRAGRVTPVVGRQYGGGGGRNASGGAGGRTSGS